MKIDIIQTFLDEVEGNLDKGLYSSKPKWQQKKALEILMDCKDKPEVNIENVIREVRGFFYEDFEIMPNYGMMRSGKYGKHHKNRGDQ